MDIDKLRRRALADTDDACALAAFLEAKDRSRKPFELILDPPRAMNLKTAFNKNANERDDGLFADGLMARQCVIKDPSLSRYVCLGRVSFRHALNDSEKVYGSKGTAFFDGWRLKLGWMAAAAFFAGALDNACGDDWEASHRARLAGWFEFDLDKVNGLLIERRDFDISRWFTYERADACDPIDLSRLSEAAATVAGLVDLSKVRILEIIDKATLDAAEKGIGHEQAMLALYRAISSGIEPADAPALLRIAASVSSMGLVDFIEATGQMICAANSAMGGDLNHLIQQ